MASTTSAGAEPLTLDAIPTAGQSIENEGKIFTTVKEGRAYILVPPNARTSVDPAGKGKHTDDGTHVQSVFYNPIQQFNRDLSVLAIKAFGEDTCRRKRERRTVAKEKEKRKLEKKGQNGKGGKRKRGDVDGEGEREGGSEKAARMHDGTEVDGSAQQGSLPEHGNGPHVAQGMDEESLHLGESNGDTHKQPSAMEDMELGSEGIELEANGTESQAASLAHGHTTPSEWRPRFRILDALSATGLRALRYASEIPAATKVVANDRDKNAVKSIKVNVLHNKLSSTIDTSTGDANGHMYRVAFPPDNSHGPHHLSGKYDVIDLDPYGTAAPFIDSALQALEDGGILCVTCTDSGVWASCGYSEKAYSLYGGMPVKGNHCHEAGLRLILHSVASAASRYGLAIEPLLSLSIDFYARMFIRVRRSPNEVKFLAGKSMLVYSCDIGCGAWTTQFIGRHNLHKNSDVNYKFGIAMAPSADRDCEHCGSRMHLAGPMWGGPLHNPAFIEKILDEVREADDETYQTKPRIEGMLDTALDELFVNPDFLSLDSTTKPSKDVAEAVVPEVLPKMPPQHIDHAPFYFVPSSLCKVVKAQAPRDEQIKGALRHAGYKVARTHCRAGAVKTNAPWSVVWEIMREWVRQKSPIKEGALKEGSPGWKIMQAMKKPDTSNSISSDGDKAADTAAEDGTPTIVTQTPEVDTAEAVPNPQAMKIVFDDSLGKDNKPGKRLVRYQQNPRENWGPMAKAKGSR